MLKKTDSSANAVTVGTTNSQTIDGATTNALSTQYASIEVVLDGSNWQIVLLDTLGCVLRARPRTQNIQKRV